MGSDADFNELWSRHTDLEFDEEQPDIYCTPAGQFAEWAAQLLQRTNEHLGLVAINQAKVLLLDRYWAWYATVSRRHQDHIGRRNRHTCIYQVFAKAYAGLRTMELAIDPPRFVEPSLPPPPPKRSIVEVPALFIGELED